METLVVLAAQHKHQYYATRSRSPDLARLNFSPPNKLREINCRGFHAADGILPTPLRASSIPAAKLTPPSPKTPATTPSAEPKFAQKSSPIPIITKPTCNMNISDEGFFDKSLLFSERWAGPTYSNSPPPSSLPMPKFLQLPKRTKSLDLPNVVSDHDVSVYPIFKSAPASPTRDFSPPAVSKVFGSADSATKTLRRILNLETTDE